MRPISLRIHGFGSYGYDQPVIEFDKPLQNLFLVTGDTGSGKSTIFDAIVYALYGNVSSSTSNKEKDSEMLISQFTDNSKTSYVELKFSEGDKEYVVRREPRQYSYKKNGERKATPESEKVTLYMPDGTIYSPKETNQHLIELVGLTKAQFMQIAMIAQGEFMQVLRESSDERKKVFRKLFDTELYERIQNEFNDRAKDKKNAVDQVLTACKTEVSHARVPENYDKYSLVASHQQSIIKSDSVNAAAVKDFVDDLDELCSALKAESDTAVKEYELANKHYLDASKEQAVANELIDDFNALDRINDELKSYASSKEEIDSLRVLVESIKKAYLVSSEYDKLSISQKNYNATKNSYDEDMVALPSLKADCQEKKATLDSLFKTKEASDTSCAKVEAEVNQALKDISGINDASEALELAKKAVATAEAKNVDAQNALAEHEKQIEELKLRAKELTGAGDRYRDSLERNGKLEDISKSYSDALAKDDVISKENSQLKNLQSELLAAVDILTSLKTEQLEANQNIIMAQAGILAEKLLDNSPCPVCGSLNHPSPCKKPDDIRLLSEDELKDLDNRVNNASDKQNQLSNEVAGLQSSIAAHDNELEGMRGKIITSLNELGSLNISEKEELTNLNSYIVELRERINNEYTTCKSQYDELQSINSTIETSDTKKKLLESSLKESLEAYNAASKEVASKESVIAELSKSLKYKNADEAKEILSKAVADRDANNRSYEVAEAAYSKVKADYDKCEGRIKENEGRLPKLKEEVDSLNKAYVEKMNALGFDEDTWKAIVRDNGHDTSTLEKRISEYDSNVSKANGAKESLVKKTAGKNKPNVVEINELVDKYKQNVIVTESRKNEVASLITINTGVLTNLKSTTASHDKLIREYSLLSSIYSVLAGKRKGNKMDIETYVQRSYLEQILDAANRRFLNMSAGQFKLEMCDIEQAGEGAKNQGLDLIVYSTVTGKRRKINTLSGGESFMAALALALGMADEIQARSAAVNLDIMFIDEGFGSLDDHSRTEAIKVLKSMAGGSKLIGIISHVTELKQEIDDMLVVTKDDNGSHAAWKNC